MDLGIVFVLSSVLTFYSIFGQQFVREIYPVQFTIPGQPRIDTFNTACNLQSVERSVNPLFQGEFVVLMTLTSL
jgi:hypothetical protein